METRDEDYAGEFIAALKVCRGKFISPRNTVFHLRRLLLTNGSRRRKRITKKYYGGEKGEITIFNAAANSHARASSRQCDFFGKCTQLKRGIQIFLRFAFLFG